jgi:hypothetical protein
MYSFYDDKYVQRICIIHIFIYLINRSFNMAKTNNPLSGYFRAPKLYTKLPSGGRFYTDDIVELGESREVAVFALTAKDEAILKNPDALLNGEAVSQIIKSCVPAVQNPRRMMSSDIDTLLVAIQGATYGDEIDVKGKCPECGAECSGIASVEGALETMNTLEESYSFETASGLTIEVKPFSYDSTIKAGIANFQSTRSLQSLSAITDELEQLKAFNSSFVRMAKVNFDLVVDSVASIRGNGENEEEFVVTDLDQIREFLENCETTIGKEIEKTIEKISKIGVNKKVQLECDEHGAFEQEVGFDPVNFFTAS